MTFFFDECISWRIAEAIGCLGYSVAHMGKEFGRGTNDVDWLPIVGERGWVLLTVDGEMHHDSPERIALAEANIVSFFLYGGYHDLRFWPQTLYILTCWPTVVATAEKANPGQCFRIRAQKRIEKMD